MIRTATTLALLLVLWGGLRAFLVWFAALASNSSLWLPLAIGAVVGIVCDASFFRMIRGFHVFEHELTHAVAAMLFMRRVRRFVVRRRGGGAVEHEGGFGGVVGDDFIGLAPYVLPTFTVLLVVPRPFVPSHWFPWYDVAIGFTFGFHLWSTVRETRLNWSSRPFPSALDGDMTHTDIARRGFVFSLVYIGVVTLLIHGALLSILVGGFEGVSHWGSEVVVGTFATIEHMSTWTERGLEAVRRFASR